MIYVKIAYICYAHTNLFNDLNIELNKHTNSCIIHKPCIIIFTRCFGYSPYIVLLLLISLFIIKKEFWEFRMQNDQKDGFSLLQEAEMLFGRLNLFSRFPRAWTFFFLKNKIHEESKEKIV